MASVEEKKVIIFDEDNFYLEKLLDYLQQNYGKRFCFLGFSKIGLCLEWTQNNHGDIFLISSTLYESLKYKKLQGVIFILTSGKEQKKWEEVPYIFKYKSAELIWKECLYHYSDHVTSVLYNISADKTDIIGFFSPWNERIQSSKVHECGVEKGKDKKVLIFNGKGYMGHNIFSKKNTLFGEMKYDLGDLLYFLTKSSPAEYIQSIIVKSAYYDYLPVVSYPHELKEADPDIWEKLLNVISKDLDYDVIILDLNEEISSVYHLLQKCSRVVLTAQNDIEGHYMTEQFMKSQRVIGDKSMYEKTEVVFY